MGAWNYQIYCNDSACDALLELEDSKDLAAEIERMMEEEFECADDYLESDVCAYGMAAASLVAVSVGDVDMSLLTEGEFGEDSPYAAIIKRAKETDLSALKEKAVQALELAKTENSELRELWEENEEYYPKWLDNLEQLVQTLK